MAQVKWEEGRGTRYLWGSTTPSGGGVSHLEGQGALKGFLFFFFGKSLLYCTFLFLSFSSKDIFMFPLMS